MGITVTRQDGDFETAQCLYRDCPGCSEKQTGVNMLYNSQMFKGVPSVSLDVKNERWDTTLKLVLNPQGFDYVMKDGIVVIRKQKRENRVRGMVTDSHGEPIPGASIIVKGTRTGTSTNIEGEFTLDVKSDKVVLEVSFIGMKKQTVQVDATRRKTVEITLVDDVKTLEDVVVTGYSNVRNPVLRVVRLRFRVMTCVRCHRQI